MATSLSKPQATYHRDCCACNRVLEGLEDKNVYKNDSVVLTCKLDVPRKEKVEWKKDGHPIKITDKLMFVSNKSTHWLAIEHALLEDSGRYSCECCHISTSADLTVIDERLIIVDNLPAKSNGPENTDIAIKCRVNRLMMKPVWRHKQKVLKSSDKYAVVTHGTTHILTIKNVTMQDEGEYTVDFGKVSSKTTLQVLGQREIDQEMFRNWVRGVLALKYTKIGLEEFSDKVVKQQHHEIMGRHGTTCNSCTEENLLPHTQRHCPRQKKSQCLCSKVKKRKSRKMCPMRGFCGTVYDRIVVDHRFKNPVMENTDIQKWSSDPWSIATCFINTIGYKGKSSAKEVDCSGLLSLCINNTFIEMTLGRVIIDGKTDAFTKARDARNDLLHSPNYKLSEKQLNKFIGLFKDVLEIKDLHGKMPLKGEPGVEEALHKIQMIQVNQIDINIDHAISQLKDHGMEEELVKCQKAKEEVQQSKIDFTSEHDPGNTQLKESVADDFRKTKEEKRQNKTVLLYEREHEKSQLKEHKKDASELDLKHEQYVEEPNKGSNLITQQRVSTEQVVTSNKNVQRQMSNPNATAMPKEQGDTMDLEKHFPELEQEIQPYPLVNILFNNGVLTDSEKDRISSAIGRQNNDRAALLEVLKTKQIPKPLMEQMLSDTNQLHLLEFFYPRRQ